jgi:hypothetical protein
MSDFAQWITSPLVSKIMIAEIGIQYLIIALANYKISDLGFAIAFLGYAIGNIGLFMKAT